MLAASGEILTECLDCGGSGELSDEQARANEEREKLAQERRRWRIDRDLTTAQAAREKGVGVIEYSRWERGLSRD